MKERAGIQSVEVGYTLLQALGKAAGPLMLRDLAAAAGMSAAKAHRYLVSFQRLELVAQDPQTTRYDLGPAALKLGLASLERLDAVKLARRRVTSLMERIGHTLALAVWGNHGPTIVHWEESPSAVTVNLRLGDVMPLLTSATGRCFAAYASRDAIAPLLREELARAQKQGRSDVPSTMAQARALLDDVRARGAARVVDVLLPGIVAFCVPVFDADGHVVLGIVALGPNGTFDPDWNGAVHGPLALAAQQLSSDLGLAGMTAAAGVPWRPLAVLLVAVLGAHALLLRGVPAAIDWRHLERAMTFSVRDVQAPQVVAAQAPVLATPAAALETPPAPIARPRAARVSSAQPPAAAAPPPLAQLPSLRMPAAATWHYVVTSTARGTVRIGTANLAWRPSAERYEAALQVIVPGGITRRQASEGAVGQRGLEPVRFSDRIRSEEATHFDRAQGRIVFSSNRADAVLQPGAQDRLSVLLQLAGMVASDAARFTPGASITLQAATTREAVEWTFTVDGEEQLALPGGMLTALKLTRAAQREYDLRIELWLAPGADYGPVRLRLTPPNGEWLDMQWSGTDKG